MLRSLRLFECRLSIAHGFWFTKRWDSISWINFGDTTHLLLIFCGQSSAECSLFNPQNVWKKWASKMSKISKMNSPRWIQRKLVRYTRNTQLIAENDWSVVRRWFRYIDFLGHRMWFLDQLTKIAITHPCDELCRATGPQIVCFDYAEVFQPEAMTGGKFSGGRRNIFNI